MVIELEPGKGRSFAKSDMIGLELLDAMIGCPPICRPVPSRVYRVVIDDCRRVAFDDRALEGLEG